VFRARESAAPPRATCVPGFDRAAAALDSTLDAERGPVAEWQFQFRGTAP